ncbi:MAG: TIM barrel protein [Bacteroidota bacterium]|nr:TIM barrel protein [Bacteroidota bacterium]
MRLKFIGTIWGMDISDSLSVINKIKDAGYDGVEIGFPVRDYDKQTEILQLAQAENMITIAQHYDADGESPEEYTKSYTAHLLFLASLKPTFINTQTGKDYFSFEENAAILEKAFAIEKETGVRIIHETHRGKFSYSLPLLREYLEKFPQLVITADFSHFCVVSESFLQTKRQKAMTDLCIARTAHLHARIGYPEGPQVNDPRAKEWEEAMGFHLQWWDKIIEQKRNDDLFTITPEFGPAPYMPQQPYTCEPLASQWEVNLFMKDLLKKRWQS